MTSYRGRSTESNALSLLELFFFLFLDSCNGAKHSPLSSAFWSTEGGKSTPQHKSMKLNNFLWNPQIQCN